MRKQLKQKSTANILMKMSLSILNSLAFCDATFSIQANSTILAVYWALHFLFLSAYLTIFHFSQPPHIQALSFCLELIEFTLCSSDDAKRKASAIQNNAKICFCIRRHSHTMTQSLSIYLVPPRNGFVSFYWSRTFRAA